MTSRGTRLLVVRPEPGAARTAARLRDAGGEVLVWPLFAVAPVAWDVPDPGEVDALLLTSANAVRHAGAGLTALATVPVVAVGAATAAAARAVGLTVVATGDGGVEEALAQAAGYPRLLHLAGRDHMPAGHATRIVYDSVALPVDGRAFAAEAAGQTVLLHSARAAARVAALLPERSGTAVAALSAAVAAAAGSGWRRVVVPARPTDVALCAAALGIGD